MGRNDAYRRTLVTPTISVVIPTHKRCEYLRIALKSVCEQSVQPSEIFVIDDAGDDATRSLVCEMSREVSGDLIYHTKKPDDYGGASSVNYGATLSRGEVLAFLDDDDRWAPNYLRDALERLSRVDGAVYTAMMVDRGDSIHPYKCLPQNLNSQNIWKHIALYNPGAQMSNLVIYRKVFIDLGKVDVSMYPASYDKDLFIRLLDAGYSYDVQKLPNVIYRRHGGNESKPSLDFASGLEIFYEKYHLRKASKVFTARTKLRVQYFKMRVSQHKWKNIIAHVVKYFL